MATVKLYLTGLRSYCVDLSLDSEHIAKFTHPRLQRIVRGIEAFHAAQEAAPVRERLPITRDLLLRLLATLDQRSHRGATLYAAFCLAFAAFLRIGEFTWEAHQWAAGDFAGWHATRRSITLDFKDGHQLDRDRHFFTLPASKTDPFRQGVTTTIAAVDDRACAVSAPHLLFTRWPYPPEAPPFILQHHDVAPGPAFDRHTTVNALGGCLAAAGIPGSYLGHSFRRGAVTSARMAGIPDHDIQLLGGWRSDTYKRYIEVRPGHICNIAGRGPRWHPARGQRPRLWAFMAGVGGGGTGPGGGEGGKVGGREGGEWGWNRA